MNNPQDKCWWKLEPYDDDIGDILADAFRQTDGFHQLRLHRASRALWAYERDILIGHRRGTDEIYGGHSYEMDSDWVSEQSRGNEIKKQVDAVTAWLFTNQPRLRVRSQNAPYRYRAMVEERSRALEGTINSSDARIQHMEVGRDGWLTGWGCEWPRYANGTIEYVRVQPHQCWWDPVDAEKGDPWAFIVAELWDRDDLAAWFGENDESVPRERRVEKRKAIQDAERVCGDWLYGQHAFVTPYQWMLANTSVSRTSDQVMVIHAWRRSTRRRENASDGRYVMMVAGPKLSSPVVLKDAPYSRTTLPVCWWAPYRCPSGGITGLGLADALYGHQNVLDRCMDTVLKHLRDLAFTKVFLDSAVAVDDVLEKFMEHNVEAIPLPGLNMAPQFIEPPAVRTDLLAMYERVRGYAQQDTGLGQVIVGGQSSLGANASGVARVEEARRGVDRVSDAYERFGAFRRRLARATLMTIEDAISINGEFASSFRDGDGSWRQCKWSKLSQLNDDYVVDIEEVGVLGSTSSGRLEKAMELADRQVLGPNSLRDLTLSYPDLTAISRMETAGLRAIDHAIAAAMDPDRQDEAYVDEHMDLAEAIRRGTAAYNEARIAGADDETLQRIATFIAQASQLLQSRSAEMQPQMS